jgi:hypothetical protein
MADETIRYPFIVRSKPAPGAFAMRAIVAFDHNDSLRRGTPVVLQAQMPIDHIMTDVSRGCTVMVRMPDRKRDNGTFSTQAKRVPLDLGDFVSAPGAWRRIDGIFEDAAQTVCCVCIDAPQSVVFMPCKHYICCATCAKKCAVCPICRVRVTDIVSRAWVAS